MYQPATNMVPTRYRLATGKLPITYRQVNDKNTKFFVSFSGDSQPGYGFRAPVSRVHSEEMECYEQHVYYYESSFYYRKAGAHLPFDGLLIKGKLRGHYVTLKRYRWEEKDEVQQEQFLNEVSVLR